MPNQSAVPNFNRVALREIRQLKGWSINKMAELMDINDGTLNRIENGVRNPSLAMAIRLADTLGVDVAAITAPKVNCTRCAERTLAA